MNIRVLVATVVGGIVMTLLGWLIFGILLMNFLKPYMIHYNGLEKDPPAWLPLIIFNFAFAWLFAFIFDYWATIRTFTGGLKGGALIMLPMVIGIDFQYMAFMNLYTSYLPVFVDIIAATVLGAIAGGVIGFVLGKMGGNPALE
ncbi:MAG TPA: hypothetical protein VF721_10185 [Pyrinomonadaceae bacterium]|jgi:hypothetical protein